MHALFDASSHAFVHCVYFRFWFFKFLVLVGITVGAFFIPDGTFNTGAAFLGFNFTLFFLSLPDFKPASKK